MNSLNILKEHLEILIGVTLIAWPLVLMVVLLVTAVSNNELKRLEKEQITLREECSMFIVSCIVVDLIASGIIILYYSQH